MDSIGVNTHFAYYLDSTSIWYQNNFSALTSALTTLGIKHIRDGLIPAYANSPTSGQNVVLHTLASSGIYCDLIADPSQGTVASQESAIKALNLTTPVAEAIEAPNEADNISTFSYNGQGFPAGDIAFQHDLYTALKADPATSGLTVIGLSEGTTYGYQGAGNPGGQPIANGALYATCDWGNCHPYAFGGNPFTARFGYETLFWYYGNGQFPSDNIGQYPYTFDIYAPPFALYNGQGQQIGLRPMAATERGYYNGTAAKSVSAISMAKYIPRTFAEDFAKGIVRTYTYELMDEGTTLSNPEDNFGLVGNNFTPKPAYYCLQNMISLLRDSKTSFTPGTLSYSINVTVPSGYGSATVTNGSYDPTTAVHSVLLQKSSGVFELLVWNDISSTSTADSSGNALIGTARDLSPPPFPAVITLDGTIVSATVHNLDPSGNVITTPGTITNHQLAVNVPDNVLIIDLAPLSSTGSDTPAMPLWALVVSAGLLLLAATWRLRQYHPVIGR